MLKQLFAGLFPLPALGNRLAFTLLAMMAGAFNLVYLQEIWPHTPAAKLVLSVVLWLVGLALLPQLMWWSWRWLRAYTGPGWVQLLATAAYLTGACVALVAWLTLLMAAPLVWLLVGTVS